MIAKEAAQSVQLEGALHILIVCTVSGCCPGAGDTAVTQAHKPFPKQLTSQGETR